MLSVNGASVPDALTLERSLWGSTTLTSCAGCVFALWMRKTVHPLHMFGDGGGIIFPGVSSVSGNVLFSLSGKNWSLLWAGRGGSVQPSCLSFRHRAHQIFPIHCLTRQTSTVHKLKKEITNVKSVLSYPVSSTLMPVFLFVFFLNLKTDPFVFCWFRFSKGWSSSFIRQSCQSCSQRSRPPHPAATSTGPQLSGAASRAHPSRQAHPNVQQVQQCYQVHDGRKTAITEQLTFSVTTESNKRPFCPFLLPEVRSLWPWASHGTPRNSTVFTATPPW